MHCAAVAARTSGCTDLRARRRLLARVPLRSDDAHELVCARELAPLRAHLQEQPKATLGGGW